MSAKYDEKNKVWHIFNDVYAGPTFRINFPKEFGGPQVIHGRKNG